MDPGASPGWLDALANGVRAALVATFCYETASRLPFIREAYWAPIAAVVVLYPDRGATQKAGLDRFLGTAVGSVVGWGAAAWWHERLAIYAAAVVVAVGICHLVNRATAARLCAVTVTVITLIPGIEPPGVVAFHRFIEVSYGVLCALAYTLAEGGLRRWRDRGRPAAGA
jgi:uncharacterized membrane protein YgaE (UPF0421/DUF939 family)